MNSELRLWTEKYRPLNLIDSGFFFHRKVCGFLTKLAENPAFPHILFYGPPGVGKRTLIKSLLYQLYQSDSVHRVISDHKEFKSHNTVVECVVMSSNYHVEVSPCEAEIHDRVIVQKLIKEVASSHQIDERQQKQFKVLVIHEMDMLTLEAQAALRRTMETYMPYCRIIGHCESLSKVILPLRSRCLLVRVNAPTTSEITNVLQKISAHEADCCFSQSQIAQIAQISRRNLRRAIITMQSLSVRLRSERRFGPHKSRQSPTPAPPEYEIKSREIARMILKEQSAGQLRTIRCRFYDLLTKGISPEMIIGVMVRELLGNGSGVAEQVKPEILKYAVIFDHRCRDGAKAIIHLEAFSAFVMKLYAESGPSVRVKKS